GYFGTRHNSTSLLRNEWTVEKEQRLLRHGRDVAHRRVLIRRGKIKSAQQSRHTAAFDEAVHRPSRYRGLRGELERHTAHCQIETCCCREHRIAQTLDFEPTPVHSPE